MRQKTFSALAIAWLLGLSAFELSHFISGVPWPGYTLVVNYISFFYITVFLIGCYYLARYQLKHPVPPFIAFTAAIIHGIAIRVGTGWQGYVLIPSGVTLLILGFYTLNSRPKSETRYDLWHHRHAA